MGNVTLIGTFHQERGRVSSSELTEILKRISPEVIFIEESPSIWRGLSEFSKTKPMEFGAISKYIEARSVKLVPVDLFTSPEPYIGNIREVLSYVERVSNRYCQLVDINEEKMTVGGFSYLNGELHENIQLEIHNEVLRILGLRRSQPLDQAYASWRSHDERRETEMVSNIEKYDLESSFERAAFLVGAGHRASIVNKLREHGPSSSTNLRWDYTNIWNV